MGCYRLTITKYKEYDMKNEFLTAAAAASVRTEELGDGVVRFWICGRSKHAAMFQRLSREARLHLYANALMGSGSDLVLDVRF